jgi:hypothetical protein
MSNAAILEALTTLPRELAADIKVCYVEATSPEAIAACMAHREQKRAAMARFFELAETLGAASFFIPGSIGADPLRPSTFTFETTPDKRTWKASKLRAGPGVKGQPFHPTKYPEGLAVKARIDAVEPIPNDHAIIDLVDAPDTIRFTADDKRDAMTTVGSGDGRFFFAAFGFVGRRNFVVFPNPFHTISELAASDYNQGLVLKPLEVLDWRPPEGWSLLGKAQFDLIVAQHNVALAEKAA